MSDIEALAERAGEWVLSQPAYTETNRYTPEQSRDFLEGVIAHLQSAVDALNEEIG